jgi:hypothetical protein
VAKGYLLSESDLEILNEVIRDHKTRPRNSRAMSQQVNVSGSPDVYIAKLPTAGIPARSGNIPGQATCEIFYTDITTPSTPSLTQVSTLTVYNFYPVAHYGTGQPYIRVQREKFGPWIAERPLYTRKCTLATTCTVGSTCTVNVWLGGGSTSNTLTAWLNWADGGEAINSGTETVIQFFEDEEKWVFTGADCQ